MSDDSGDKEWQPPFVLLSGDLSRLDRQALETLSPEQRGRAADGSQGAVPLRGRCSRRC